MDIIFFNFQWMGLNIFLAFLGVLFGWLFLKAKNIATQILFFALWLVFVPNTIYLVTDMQYIPEQIAQVGIVFKVIILLQFLVLLILGPITFILGMYPVDKIFKEVHLKKKSELRVLILVILNFVIGFAVVLGKFQRTNSWDILVNFNKVIYDSLILYSDQSLIILSLAFGIFTNFLYFGYKKVFNSKS